jgi:mannose-6-phosphate isomerase-like protein (cupin superfamily)
MGTNGIFILRGQAQVRIGSEEVELGPQDVVYVQGGESHQFAAIGAEPLGFLRVVPAV